MYAVLCCSKHLRAHSVLHTSNPFTGHSTKVVLMCAGILHGLEIFWNLETLVLKKVKFFLQNPAPKIETVQLLTPFTIPNCATYLPEASQNWQSD